MRKNHTCNAENLRYVELKFKGTHRNIDVLRRDFWTLPQTLKNLIKIIGCIEVRPAERSSPPLIAKSLTQQTFLNCWFLLVSSL